MTFADKLKELRARAKLTQAELADKAKIPASTVRGYEYGQRLPLAPAFMRLVQALGVTCDAFANCDDMLDDKPKPKAKGKGKK
jgi:transcriptional regulator with XRE-family HTH domain